jgi:predicted YcjX-like family ATPase
VSYVDPGFTAFGTFGNALLRMATFGFVALRGVQRIAFVATKADRVWQDDRSKLEGLLRDMAVPLVRGHQAVKHLQVDYMVCAAVDATRSDVQGQTHTLQFKAPDGATLRQTVPQLPEHWPDQWDALAYAFPKPLPWMPENRNNPPDHINLHRIAELVLS